MQKDKAGIIADLTKQKDDAYLERNKLVALLAAIYPSNLQRHLEDGWETDWRWMVVIDLPTGQASFHLHDSHLPLFDHVLRGEAKVWDGHTTEQKYQRISTLITKIQQSKRQLSVPRKVKGAKYE